MRVAVIALACVPAVFAATNNCPTSTGTLSRTWGGGGDAVTYNSQTVPGALTTNNLASASTPGPEGCTALDLTFNNFGVTTSGTNELGLPTTAGTYVSVTPTGTTQTVPDTLLFSTLQGNGSGADNALNDGSDNYKVDGTETMTGTTSFTVTDTGSTGIWSVLLGVNGVSKGTTGDSVTASINVCEGGTETGVVTSGTCATDGGVFVSVGPVTLTQSAAQTIFLALPAHPTYIDISETFALTCSGCGTSGTYYEVALLSFSDQFAESPEPATFGLMAASLLGLGLYTRRRRAISKLSRS